jgi:hypothetical protein
MEAGFIRNIWKRHPKILEGWRNSCAYIGIHDEYTEGEYITVFGMAISTASLIKLRYYIKSRKSIRLYKYLALMA